MCVCVCACACEWRRCALPLVWASCAPAAGAGGGVVAARVFALPAAPVSPTPPCFVRPAWLALGQSVCVYYFFRFFFSLSCLHPPCFGGSMVALVARWGVCVHASAMLEKEI